MSNIQEFYSLRESIKELKESNNLKLDIILVLKQLDEIINEIKYNNNIIDIIKVYCDSCDEDIEKF